MARLPAIPDLVDWIKALARRIDKLETAARLGYSTISRGGLTIAGFGRLLIAAGGSLLLRDGQERDLFYVGGFQETQPGVPNGYGAFLRRLDGSYALHFSDDSGSEQVQRVKWYDRNGRKIFAEDPQGDGLEWPAIPIPFGSTDYTTWAGADTASFAPVAAGFTYRMHRRAYVSVRHTTDAADTTGELRLLANGAPIGSTVAVGFLVSQAVIGPFDVPGDGGSNVTYTLEARRTAGTGRVRASVDSAWAGGFF